MPTRTLKRAPARPSPHVSLAPGLALLAGRVHEACGGARRSFAMWLATRLPAHVPIFWVAPDWGSDRLNPDGVRRFVNPARITFISVRRPDDLLWTMEEVLRSGAVPLVITDMPAPPGLTLVRRLHLAAETGAAQGTHVPLGLLLTPGDGGAQGIESRWRMAPAHTTKGEGWTLDRLRARTAPEKRWQVDVTDNAFRVQDPTPTAQATPA